MGVGIVRGDYWGDLELDLGRDRARIEPENNIATLVNCVLTPGKRKPLLLSQKKERGEL